MPDPLPRMTSWRRYHANESIPRPPGPHNTRKDPHLHDLALDELVIAAGRVLEWTYPPDPCLNTAPLKLSVQSLLGAGPLERIGQGPAQTTLEQKEKQAERACYQGQEQGQARRPLLSQTRPIDPDPDKEIEGQI